MLVDGWMGVCVDWGGVWECVCSGWVDQSVCVVGGVSGLSGP